jgi:hypothetical protein
MYTTRVGFHAGPHERPENYMGGTILFHSPMHHQIFTRGETHLILHGHSSFMNGVFISRIFHLLCIKFL